MIKSHALTNKLLETLVNKVYENGLIDQLRKNIFIKKNISLGGETPLLVQAEIELHRTRSISLKRSYGEISTSSAQFSRRIETTSVDMGEVQRIIDSALKKRPKVLKFIHPYMAFVERFQYPQGFKIPDFSLFTGELPLSLFEHVARFTT